jgi:hypothetical protein
MRPGGCGREGFCYIDRVSQAGAFVRTFQAAVAGSYFYSYCTYE